MAYYIGLGMAHPVIISGEDMVNILAELGEESVDDEGCHPFYLACGNSYDVSSALDFGEEVKDSGIGTLLVYTLAEITLAIYLYSIMSFSLAQSVEIFERIFKRRADKGPEGGEVGHVNAEMTQGMLSTAGDALTAVD